MKKLLRRGGCLLLLLSCSAPAWAQVDRRVQPQPDSEFETIPFSEVIRDDSAPYENLFQRITVGPNLEPRFGEGGEGRIAVGGFARPDFDSPFAQGFRPEDAELKLGPFYLDVRSLSGAVLWSDNINRTEINEEADAIAMARLHLVALLQLTENLRIALSGVVVYLPFENEIGIAGFGVDDFFARFDYGPIGRVQLSYNLRAADWEILFYNDLTLRYLRSAEGIDFELFDYEGEEFTEEDRAGRYFFRTRRFATRDADTFGDRNRRGLDESFIGLRNAVGASASTILPTVTRLTLGAEHQNLWYYDRPDDARLPETRDQLYAHLVSERETMRFKPYATFRTWTTDLIDSWRKEAHAGLFGPVTENISFLGDVGYFWGDRTTDSLLWRLRLTHTPHPRMSHSLHFSKRITEPDEDLEETLTYRLRYVFSEDLRMEVLIQRSDFDDIDASGSGSEELRAGIRFTYDLAQRTSLRVGTIFTKIDAESPTSPDFEKWTSRVELLYRYTDSIHARAMYQYETRDSNLPLDSYEENLVLVVLTKYF